MENGKRAVSEKERARRREQGRKWRTENPEKAKAIQIAYRERNPGKTAEASKRYRQRLPGEVSRSRGQHHRLKSMYGITLEQYNEIGERQRWRCLGCDLKLLSDHDSPKNSKPHVDHCHRTGRVRGLLCGHCNSALGHAKDSADILRNLLDYIKRHDIDKIRRLR